MKTYAKTASALILAAGSGLGLAACGSGSASPAVSSPSAVRSAAEARTASPTAATTSGGASVPARSVNYGKQYLGDVAPTNAAAQAITSDDTFTSPAVIALGAAATRTARELLTQTWPSNAQSDIHALAIEAEKVNSDIQMQDLTALQSDVENLNAQAQAVRADLGLPAAK